MGRVSKSCTRAKTSGAWCGDINAGSGSPAMCPIDTYKSGTAKHMHTITRLFIASSSAFFSASCFLRFSAASASALTYSFAPKLRRDTSSIIFSASSVSS